MPENNEGAPPEQEQIQSVNRKWRFDILVVGLLLIGLGSILLYGSLDSEFDMRDFILTYWPVLLIGAGFVKIVQSLMGYSGKGSGIGLLVFIAILLIIAAGVPWESGGIRLFWFGQLSEVYSKTIPMEQGGKLQIKSEYSDIRVYGYGGDDIKLTVKTYVNFWDRKQTRDYSELEPRIVTSGTGVRIISEPSGGRKSRQRGRAVLELRVPRGIALEVVTDQADVRVVDLDSEIHIETQNGDIDIEDVTGFVELTIESGDVDLEHLTGGVTISGRRVGVEMDEVYGPITIDLERGSVELEDYRQVDADIDIRTGWGNVSLELNERSDIDFKAFSSGGRIVCDFLDVEEKIRDSFSRKFNDGTYVVRLRTERGTVRLDHD